jgi:hypothetical protein
MKQQMQITYLLKGLYSDPIRELELTVKKKTKTQDERVVETTQMDRCPHAPCKGEPATRCLDC